MSFDHYINIRLTMDPPHQLNVRCGNKRIFIDHIKSLIVMITGE